MAPVPPRIVAKGVVSGRAVIYRLAAKYVDHVCRLVGTRRGIGKAYGWGPDPRATLDGWVMRVGELLVRVGAAMG